MVLKGNWARVLKGVKMNTFGDNVWTARGRGLNFWHVVHIYAGHFVCQFQVTATISFWDIAVFCVSKKCHQICSYTVSMGTIGLCVQFEWKILKFNGWCYFWQDMSQCASKMLNLQQEMQWSWKEIILNQIGQNDLVFDHFDWDFARCEAMDIYVFKLFNNFTVYNLCEQIWLFCQFCTTGKKPV